MKSICIISQRYPCPATPAVHVFVQKLAWSLADHGVAVSIISPVPVYDRKFSNMPECYEEVSPKGNILQIYRPRFLYCGERNLGPFHLSHLSANTMCKAATRMIEKYHIDTEVFYGHFICVAGIIACRLGKKYHKPAYIAYGESTDWSLKQFGLTKVKDETKEISGFVAVSTSNRNKLINAGLANDNTVKVFVNGFNENIFYPRDRRIAREKYGIGNQDFAVAFVGQFSERKGVFRLNEAIEGLDRSVKVMYAGRGEKKPTGSHVLWANIIKPEDVPEFLSAADVFCLPTQNEGCSNAILEAIACGIPVISSDRDFNYDILDKDNAILIDPDSVSEIREAICALKNNQELRNQLSEASLRKRMELTLDRRAENIMQWIDYRNEKYYSR